MRMVEVMSKKTLLKFKYFWYLVAFLCIIDKVDLADPDLSKGILIQSLVKLNCEQILCLLLFPKIQQLHLWVITKRWPNKAGMGSAGWLWKQRSATSRQQVKFENSFKPHSLRGNTPLNGSQMFKKLHCALLECQQAFNSWIWECIY